MIGSTYKLDLLSHHCFIYLILICISMVKYVMKRTYENVSNDSFSFKDSKSRHPKRQCSCSSTERLISDVTQQ